MNGRKIKVSHGFSVAELLTVIAILSILAALTVVNQSKLGLAYRLNSSSRQVMTDLRLARSKSIAQNTQFRVLFTSGATGYEVERLNSSVSPAVWEDYRLTGHGAGAITPGTPQVIALPVGIVSKGVVTVTFLPRGAAVTNPASTPVLLGPTNGSAGRAVAVGLNGLVEITSP